MNNRCFMCMSPTDGGKCQSCGYDNDGYGADSTVLTPGTMVKNRYYIGLPLHRNGESVVYIGYDILNNRRVRVSEFFPDALCDRAQSGEVVIKQGKDIQTKALMNDFVELSRQLMNLTAGSGVAHVCDLLSDNATIYAVYEDIDGMSLSEFLRKNGGQLEWEEIEPLFMPLLYAVKLLNSNGVIHRGISLESIIVTPLRELKLINICTSAVRAINTEITPELYDGYSAPEQYQRCISHGEWTDIYAICAVLYRILTGVTPERADMRTPGEPITNPRKLNLKIPYGVAQAIVNGMAYDQAERTQTVSELITGFYAAPQVKSIDIHATAPQPLDSRKRGFRVPIWLMAVLITLPVLLIVFFMLYSAMTPHTEEPSSSISSSSEVSSDVSQSIAPSSEPSSSEISSVPSSEENTPSVTVNNFVGKYYDDVVSTELYMQWFKFTAKEEYDDNAAVGEIISQSVEPNKVVPSGSEIELVVSLGKQYVIIPPLLDSSGNAISVEQYKQYLEKEGVTVKLAEVNSNSTPTGEIDSLSVPVGSSIDRKVTNEVTIYVSIYSGIEEE